MDHFDDSRIRALVTDDFESFSNDIIEAEAMNGFAEAVTANAVGTVRELMHAFNEASFMSRIPPEILAACFAHLPSYCRLLTSHVCHSWRAAALSAPELWSKINSRTSSNSPQFLHLALSRAGAMPLYLRLEPEPPAAPQAIYSAVAPFSRQIRYLEWHSEHPASGWDFPATSMECFSTSQTITITDHFLGGTEGRLRCLYLQCAYLPETCPVLSTVTDLSIVLTPFAEGARPSTLTNLFVLFPQLDWLQILGITGAAAHMLPSGRAPTSLRELSLQSLSWDYDLASLHATWDNGSLEHVSLSQYPGISPDLDRVAKGAIRLAVRYENDQATTRVMFEHSASVSHSVSVAQFNITDVAFALDAVQSSLVDVHTAMISHGALRPLAGVLAALPTVVHLFVHIMPRMPDGTRHPRRDEHAFDWSKLACLEDLARAMSRLRAVTLQVWSWGTPSPATADEARALLVQLRALNGPFPPVTIQGFCAKEAAGIDLGGLNVRFDVATPVGDLRFHEPREPYDPCW